jgi:serine protease AprX
VNINLRPMKKHAGTFTAVLVILLGSTSAFAAHRKLSSELNDKLANPATNLPGAAGNGSYVDVIIQFRPGAKLDSGITKVTGVGGQHKSRLDVINGSLFRVPVGLLATLAEDPDVTYISPDRKTIKLGRVDKILDATNTTSIINLGYTGDDVGVAVIDSGVKSNHPDLTEGNYNTSRVVYSQSFVPGLDASDQFGHGTHVAGIIAGNGNTSGQWMIGIASRANIINLRVLDAAGAGTDSAVIAAIQRAIQLKNTYGIRIINLSLGRSVAESYTLDPLCQAVEQAWKAGIVVVVAAGNDGRDNTMNTNGYGTITAPGNDPYVITVGATNTHATDTTYDDTMTSYSSKGPTLFDHVIKPDLVAPGNQVVSLLANGSTLDTLYPQNELSPSLYGGHSYNGASYVYMSGTSMAAPIVSGAVALMLEYMPNLTPDQVKARLMTTAIKMSQSNGTEQASNGTAYNTQYDIFTVGAGVLDTYDAMAASGTPNGTALSPIAVLDRSGNVLLQADPSSVWSNSVTWGTSVVWGNVLVNGTSVIWGNSVVWGNSTMAGNSVIWGNSVTWGNLVDYSETGDCDKN